MLGLAVAVLMPGVRRAHRDSDREERQERRDQVGARVHRLGENTEAAGRDARAELQPDQGQRGEDGEERSTALSGHERRSVRGASANRCERPEHDVLAAREMAERGTVEPDR